MQFGTPIVSAVVAYNGYESIYDDAGTGGTGNITNGSVFTVSFNVPLRVRTLSLSHLFLNPGWNVQIKGNRTNALYANNDFTGTPAWRVYNVAINPEQEQGSSGTVPNGYGTFQLIITNNTGVTSQAFTKILGTVDVLGAVNGPPGVPFHVTVDSLPGVVVSNVPHVIVDAPTAGVKVREFGITNIVRADVATGTVAALIPAATSGFTNQILYAHFSTNGTTTASNATFTFKDGNGFIADLVVNPNSPSDSFDFRGYAPNGALGYQATVTGPNSCVINVGYRVVPNAQL